MKKRHKGRLSNEQLVEYASKGMTYRQIAKKDGTTPANISQRLKRLKKKAVIHIARDEKRGDAITKHNLDAGEQLTKISFHVNQLLDQATSEEGEINRLVAIAGIELERDKEDSDPKITQDLLRDIVTEFHNNQDIIFRASAEIREQIRLQLDIFKVWYSHQAIQEFQRIVLDAVGSVDPELRDRIIKELSRRQLVR
jgi:DNA-binding Lrp family transcriptional regulator